MINKKTHIYFIIGALYPGGLGQSAVRILNALSSIEDFIVHIYITGTKDVLTNSGNVINIYNTKEFLLQPYGGLQQVPIWEKNRVDFLILKNNIEKNINKYTEDNHVIISFYISTTGFICQIIADSLNISHIASIRGSDFSRDLFRANGMNIVEWVVKRADHIVTTNNEQLGSINTFFSKSKKITTIYNAISQDFLNCKWTYKEKTKVKLFSDCGYSFKKATHILLASVEKLLKKGYLIQLDLIGDIDLSQAKNNSYWKDLRHDYQEKYPESFNFQYHLKSLDLLEIMLGSDIYVSSTLSEGCSNARLQALAIGIPMVSTKTGELQDIISMLGANDHISLSKPGDLNEFTDCLEKMIIKIQNRTCQPDKQYTEAIKNLFTLSNERYAWEKIIRSVT